MLHFQKSVRYFSAIRKPITDAYFHVHQKSLQKPGLLTTTGAQTSGKNPVLATEEFLLS